MLAQMFVVVKMVHKIVIKVFIYFIVLVVLELITYANAKVVTLETLVGIVSSTYVKFIR